MKECLCGHDERDHLRKKSICRKFMCECAEFRLKSPDARYRVDFFIKETQQWAEYTAKKRLLELPMAEAYASHLGRSKQRWRIVEVLGKVENVVKEAVCD